MVINKRKPVDLWPRCATRMGVVHRKEIVSYGTRVHVKGIHYRIDNYQSIGIFDSGTDLPTISGKTPSIIGSHRFPHDTATTDTPFTSWTCNSLSPTSYPSSNILPRTSRTFNTQVYNSALTLTLYKFCQLRSMYLSPSS